MKRLSDDQKRVYRILVLAIAFFAVGLYFFLSDHPWTSKPSGASSSTTASAGANSGGVQSGNGSYANLGSYPPQSQFRTFTYNSGLIDGAPALAVTSTCSDAYAAVLVFPTTVDYRQDPARAVYNKAFPCVSGSEVSTTIDAASLGSTASGTYYYFTADQGASGLWYNPK